MSDTIFALASGVGRSGVAVVRVSGPESSFLLLALAPDLGGGLLPPRRATRAGLCDSESKAAIDEALVIWFPAPHSYTGEDVAEFHVHGGPTVIDGLCRNLAAYPRVRPAEPGEFTRRAFENGKMDLTAAEGLADLVAAETDRQRRQALRQMQGGLAELYDRWRDTLVHGMAHMEAAIDFADEDLPEGLTTEAMGSVAGIEKEIADHLADGHRGERVRDGLRVAIIGAPNAGKSSLLNALARRDAAIVSETAWTTRDVVEVHLDVDGFAVVLADTAGLRDGGGDIEREGMRRARMRAATADLRIAVVDAVARTTVDEHTAALLQDGDVVAPNKIDLDHAGWDSGSVPWTTCFVSTKTGVGLDDLFAVIAGRVARDDALAETPPLTRLRHRAALEECTLSLGRAAAAHAEGVGAELVAEDLRLGVRALGRITGRVDVEDLLDVIFRDFCIGK